MTSVLTDDQIQARQIEMMMRASKSIWHCTFLMTVPSAGTAPGAANMARVLATAAGRKIEVNVILNQHRFSMTRRSPCGLAARWLTLNGVNVRLANPSVLLHAKVLIVDESHAVVSSANSTDSAHRHNKEAGVYLDDKPSIQSLLTWAAEIQRAAVPHIASRG